VKRRIHVYVFVFSLACSFFDVLNALLASVVGWLSRDADVKQFSRKQFNCGATLSAGRLAEILSKGFLNAFFRFSLSNY